MVVVAALVLPNCAFAEGWTPPAYITGYYVWDSGMAHIKTSNNQNDGCTSARYLTIDTSQPNFKSMWAQVIAAHTAGQTVSVYLDGCIGPHPKVRAISVPEAW